MRSHQQWLPGPARAGHAPRVLMADRGDPLVRPLTIALGRRFQVVDQVRAELSSWERLVVGAGTFRPNRADWAERFFKSNAGAALRSRRARRGIDATTEAADVVFQTHALFETGDERTVLYLDCTHRQSMEQWPAWNPLRGRALRRWLAREERQYQQAAHLLAFSEETARSLHEQYDVPRRRISVVGAGVNFLRFPGPPLDRRERAAAPTILFVGNDFDRKGGPQLLDAFARLHHRFPDSRLRIVGTHHPLSPRPGVEQLGRVRDREQLARLYAEADVFCLPSHFDPFPGALLEAMAHGLPCVVTSTCGVPEIVGPDAALTVGRGPTMVDDLVGALEHLLVSPAAAHEMGLRGRARVEERFAWSHVVDRMAPALERVAGLPLPPPAPPPGPPPAPHRPSTQTVTPPTRGARP